jgi:hypothetical protein
VILLQEPVIENPMKKLVFALALLMSLLPAHRAAGQT